jgi:hypothetical protein
MSEPVPAFEGRPVDGVSVRVSGAAPLDDLNQSVLSIDDRVQLVATYTVTGVHHTVDRATGNLLRVQTIKPVEMHLLPFDETDPADDGIIRALPYQVVHAIGGNGGNGAGVADQ